jgi:DNA-binding transcriptional regulator YdaS (Cro superfamily)
MANTSQFWCTLVGMESNIVQQVISKAGSQVMLAARLGVKQQSVSRWCKAKQFPAKRAAQVAKLYGLALSDLLGV